MLHEVELSFVSTENNADQTDASLVTDWLKQNKTCAGTVATSPSLSYWSPVPVSMIG